MNLVSITTLLSSLVVSVCGQNIVVDSGLPTPTENYVNSAEMDEYGSYFLFWKFDEQEVTIEIHVKTHGWVGFGISPNGGMAGADIVIGWIKDSKVYFSDRHATTTAVPIKDESQDYQLIHAEETGEFTMFKFKRLRKLCNDYDIPITTDTSRVIFAWNDDDPVDEEALVYHGATRRGSKSVVFIDYGDVVKQESLKDVQEGDLMTVDLAVTNVSIPQQRTTYFCRIPP